MSEKTLSIIKPDATARGLTKEIIKAFEGNGIKIVKKVEKNLTQKEAENFYLEHKERPFYKSLVKFMTSGPVVLMVLEGKNVIEKNREIMGATNPGEAAPGTLRAKYGESIERNSVHGSDSPKSAQREIKFFFPDLING